MNLSAFYYFKTKSREQTNKNFNVSYFREICKNFNSWYFKIKIWSKSCLCNYRIFFDVKNHLDFFVAYFTLLQRKPYFTFFVFASRPAAGRFDIIYVRVCGYFQRTVSSS